MPMKSFGLGHTFGTTYLTPPLQAKVCCYKVWTDAICGRIQADNCGSGWTELVKGVGVVEQHMAVPKSSHNR